MYSFPQPLHGRANGLAATIRALAAAGGSTSSVASAGTPKAPTTCTPSVRSKKKNAALTLFLH